MTTITALFIPADDTQAPKLRQVETATRLKTLQDAVGGLIEVVNLPGVEADMFINEEGKILGLPVNTRATGLWGACYGVTALGDYIAGDAIITGGPDEEGETTGINALQMWKLARTLRRI